MANNFYKNIDEAFDRFEVGHIGMVYQNIANSVWIPVHVTIVLSKYNIIIIYYYCFFFLQIYVKKNILKIPPHVLLPEDKVKKMTISHQVNYHLKAQCDFVINFVTLFYMKSYGATIRVKPWFGSIFTWYYPSMF